MLDHYSGHRITGDREKIREAQKEWAILDLN
jgi:hypothetical protein